MAQANVNVRMDEELKSRFDDFCSEIGMNMSTAICIFVKKVVREQRIPFELSLSDDPFYSEENIARLEAAAERIRQGKGIAHELIGAAADEDNLG